MRDRLRRKYLSLGIGEFTAIAVFVLAASLAVTPRLTGSEPIALWSALIPLGFVLAQGGAFWLLARGWVGSSTMPRALATAFKALRVLNPIVILGGAIGIAAAWPLRPWVLVLSAAVLLFAVVEYVNYYVARLAYPVSRWFTEVGQWRTPRLMIDVNEAA